LAPSGSDLVPQLNVWLDKFIGKDSGDTGYPGDGIAGQESYPFRTWTGMMAKVPANARITVHLGGGPLTDIGTMLLNPGSYHAYGFTTPLILPYSDPANPTSAKVYSVIGRGHNIKAAKAATLIYDATGFPSGQLTIAASPTGATESGTTVTITTTTAHGRAVGDSVDVEGVANPKYNGRVDIVATPTTTSFTFVLASSSHCVGATAPISWHSRNRLSHCSAGRLSVPG